MTARLIAVDLLATLLVAALWLGTAGAVLAGRARVALAVLAAAVLATVGRVAVVFVLAGSGWWFVQEKVLLTLPMVVLPGAAAVVLTGPALLRAAKGGPAPGWWALAAVLGAAGGGIAGLLGTFVVGYPVTPTAAVLLTLLAVLPALWPLVPRSVLVGTVALAVLLAVGSVGGAWWGSRLPDRLGHGGNGGNVHAHHTVSVADLRGPLPQPGEAVRRFTLTARLADVPIGGRTVPAWTFDGQLPGPQLTATQGELVEVTLRNADIADGVTLHWHGYPVPAGEDGVAGVTQDAVPPGDEFTYRFRASEAGTYWYHSHQVSAEAVRLGLYGVLVVQPASPSPEVDVVVPLHTQAGSLLTGSTAGLDRRAVPPGSTVRLRVVNTDDGPHALALRGAEYRLAAVDGRDMPEGPSLGADALLPLAAGGRYDLTFPMPDGPVHLAVEGRAGSGLLLSGDGTGDPPPPTGPGRLLDITQHAVAPSGPEPPFDREYTLVLDRTLGFLDGVPRLVYPVNGRVFPNVPDLAVRTGELVRITVVNRGTEPHPMHPHGHAVLVLARNGVPAVGPLWTDSFDVGPGEVWEVALRADNPGLWLSHCHNLEHAAQGMVLHLAYEGVGTPFAVGDATRNHPE